MQAPLLYAIIKLRYIAFYGRRGGIFILFQYTSYKTKQELIAVYKSYCKQTQKQLRILYILLAVLAFVLVIARMGRFLNIYGGFHRIVIRENLLFIAFSILFAGFLLLSTVLRPYILANSIEQQLKASSLPMEHVIKIYPEYIEAESIQSLEHYAWHQFQSTWYDNGYIIMHVGPGLIHFSVAGTPPHVLQQLFALLNARTKFKVY